MEVKDDNCIFCRIAAGELGVEPVYETQNTFFFRDHQPKARVHVLGIPKQHWVSLDAVPSDEAQVLSELMQGIQEVAKKEGLVSEGYRVITNIGYHGGQEVKHLHFHILGGEPLGKMVCK